MATLEHSELALDFHETALSKLHGVVGLGIVPLSSENDTDLAVAIYVEKQRPEEQLEGAQALPQTLELLHQGELIEVPTRIVEIHAISLDST